MTEGLCDMPLALVVDKIDTVPEAQRALYVEKDGKHHLDVTGLPVVEDVSGLKNALNSEREAAKAAKAQISAWQKLGKTPEEIEGMLQSEREKAEQAALKAGKFDEVLQNKLGEQKKQYDTVVETATKQRDSALSVARTAIINTQVGGALVKSKATAEGIDLLTERLGKRVKLEFGEDGSHTLSLLAADGTPMYGPDGKPATFDDLVKEAAKQYPSLFEGTGNGGGGKPPNNAGGTGAKTITRKDFDALSPLERAAKIKDGFKLVD